MKKAIPFIILAVCVLIVITTSIVQFVALHPKTNTPTTTPPAIENTTPTTPPETLPASIMPDGVYTLVAGNFAPSTLLRDSMEYLMNYVHYSIIIQDGLLGVTTDGFKTDFTEADGIVTIELPELVQNAFELDQTNELRLQYNPELDCIVLTNGESTGYFKRFDSIDSATTWLLPFFGEIPSFNIPADLSWYESFGEEVVPPIE